MVFELQRSQKANFEDVYRVVVRIAISDHEKNLDNLSWIL